MDERERFAAGEQVRRAVLGDAHVDQSLAKRNALNEPLQDLITRYAWGEIWSRPELPRHTRSLLTLAMLVALNRTEELRIHLRRAANNHVTREEIGRYVPTNVALPNYAVTPDGQRFLRIKDNGPAQAPTQIRVRAVLAARAINVALNWFEELKQKVPPTKK